MLYVEPFKPYVQSSNGQKQLSILNSQLSSPVLQIKAVALSTELRMTSDHGKRRLLLVLYCSMAAFCGETSFSL